MFDKEYVFYGKHAQMVKRLTGKLSDAIGKGFFSTNYDVYRVAPIIGYVYNRRAVVERSGSTTKIFGDKMKDEHDDLVFNYRLLMMLINEDKNADEIINISFRLDDKDEERKPFDQLYNEYVLGGIEEIYERIFEANDADNVDGYLMNLCEFMEELNVRLYGATI